MSLPVRCLITLTGKGTSFLLEILAGKAEESDESSGKIHQIEKMLFLPFGAKQFWGLVVSIRMGLAGWALPCEPQPWTRQHWGPNMEVKLPKGSVYHLLKHVPFWGMGVEKVHDGGVIRVRDQFAQGPICYQRPPIIQGAPDCLAIEHGASTRCEEKCII